FAQSFNGRAALLIEEVGAELHCNAIQLLERMAQQQQLALGVQRAALYALSIPSGADLHAAVDGIDMHERRHANRFVGGFFDDGKRQHRTLSLKFQAAVDFRPQPIGCGNAGVPEGPQLAILHTLDQIAVMRMCQGHERHMLSMQRYRLNKTHDLSLIILRGWPPANSDRHNGSMTARIIYSTGVGSLCPNCRRPVRDCVCPKGAPGAAKPGAVRVGRETKGRAGKGVTTVTGLPMPLSDGESLARRLKKRCGSGGTV